MELKQVKGNTWYLAEWQLIPLYKTDESHCILLDTGLIRQREDIEKTLLENGLTPIGILGSHAHTDHSPNHHYFREKYHIPVALSLGEAAISENPLMLKAYYYMLSEDQLLSYPEYREMLCRVDRIIMPSEEKISFCGPEFDIMHTPGHSPDHISIGTLDGVLYLGDAVLTGESLKNAKLPYFFAVKAAERSFEKLEQTDYACYLAAHRGVYDRLDEVLVQNRNRLKEVSEDLAGLVDRPMTISELIEIVCEKYSLLSSRLRKSTYYERNVRAYLDYMADTGMVEEYAYRGVTIVRPVNSKL